MKSKKAMIKKIEYHLRQYKTYLISIKNIQQQLEWILPSVTANYEISEGSSGTFHISSKVEKAVLDRLESKHALDLHEEMERYKIIVDSINRALEPLTETERAFVQKRYFERKGIAQVAEELGYSEKWLHQIRNRVMDSLLISLSNILKLG
jgi:RinA family phage transcriptional activator